MPKCYDGLLLLPFDYGEEVYIRDDSTQTEQACITREKQIDAFMRAGERLDVVRRTEFEYPDGVVPDDVDIDPMLRLGFDYADASAEMNRLKAKAKAAEKAKDVEESKHETPDPEASASS